MARGGWDERTMDTCAAEYQREGFLVIEDLLPNEVIKSLRKRITEIGERRVPGFPDKDIEYEPGDNGNVKIRYR